MREVNKSSLESPAGLLESPAGLLESPAGLEVLYGILAKITDGFFVVDRGWNILLANESASFIAKKPLSEIIGNNLWAVVPEYRDTPIYDHYQQAMASGKPEIFLTHLKEFDIWVETRLFPSEKGLTSYFRDITEQVKSDTKLKKTLASLEQATKELSRSNGDLSQFAMIASHDLKEPLKSIALWIDLAVREQDTLVREKCLARASENSRKCLSLIESLLSYSSMGSDKFEVGKVPMDYILKTVVESLSKIIADCGAKIEWKNLPIVSANSLYLVRIFQNLISNAIKYRHPERTPVIKIGCEEFWDRFEFSVIDNGSGIPESALSKVFELFQRAPNSDGIQGQGIGLATVKRLIEIHGGSVKALSRLNESTNIKLTLPKMT